MEIRTLRYVVTLAEELHFGRAAGRHFISAQPFGQHIQRLERELGVRLFQRTSRRVQLTPTGESFVEQARSVLAQLERLRMITAGDGPPDGAPLRIGVLGFGAADRWQPLRDAVLVQQPGLALEYQDLDLSDQYDAVRLGQVDVAVVQYVGELEGLEFAPVLACPRVAVVPASSPLADAPALELDDLAGCRWLNVATREPSLRSWMGPAVDTSTPPVRHPSVIPTAVAMTGRVSLHAAVAANYYPRPDVRFVPLKGPDVEIAIATRRGDNRPCVAAFRRAARSVQETDRNRFA